MKIQIFDVEHGACSLVTADTGARMLIDCGHNSTTNWRPSSYLKSIGVQHLDELVITNYDEDHASDLPNLRRTVSIHTLTRNPTVSGDDLRYLKDEDGIGAGIETLAAMTSHYSNDVTEPPNFGSLSSRHFWNDYRTDFVDENNLSLVLILKCHGLTICFPGDMEIEGWKHLLTNWPGFAQAMSEVNVLVASHHGRENGCCDQLFSWTGWKPRIVIISDSGKEYATQETINWYRARSHGMNYFGKERHVFTTRSDGRILLEATPNGTTINTRVQG